MAAGSGTAQHGGPSGTSDRAQVLAAIKKYGPSVSALAEKRYGISGEALLAKLAQGESSAISDPSAAKGKVSSAGARGWTQFTAASRAEAIRKYGIDPWASPDAAFHGASLHLRGKINGSTGLEGYNPGDPHYPAYILGQKVGDVHGAAGRVGGSAASAGGMAATTAAASDSGLSQAFDAGQGSLSSLLKTAAPAPVAAGSLPALPSFAAGPSLPDGYQLPASGGGPQPVQEVPLPTTSDLSMPAVSPATGAPAVSDSASGITKAGGALVSAAIERANTLDAQHLPYLWGGGHGGKVDVANTGPLDCSGAVSAVLKIDPRVSGDFETFGSPGRAKGGKGINIYANDKHVLMEIDGHFFGTSKSNPGGGAGWIPRDQLSAGYLKGFTVRHLARTG